MKLDYVMLIDDDEPTNYLHQRIFELGHIAKRIEIAWDGEEALERLRSRQENEPVPDLILLDINMPNMDGWEFLEAYDSLALSQRAKIVIVMLTTSINPDDKARSLNQKHIAGFERKPLKMETIEQVLGKYFP